MHCRGIAWSCCGDLDCVVLKGNLVGCRSVAQWIVMAREYAEDRDILDEQYLAKGQSLKWAQRCRAAEHSWEESIFRHGGANEYYSRLEGSGCLQAPEGVASAQCNKVARQRYKGVRLAYVAGLLCTYWYVQGMDSGGLALVCGILGRRTGVWVRKHSPRDNK